ncbi:hypothetical protein ASF45_27890 [Pseudorhodoferax sp. Leaf265]|nr:hypothetical protein ASF45_27890 [Pseudorhodoferax sp. Leaf265]
MRVRAEQMLTHAAAQEWTVARRQRRRHGASGTASKPQGRLRVQCMASFGQHYVAPMLADFCAHHPEMTVNYSTSQYFPDLLARGVDVSL